MRHLSLTQRLVMWQHLLFAGGLLLWSQRRRPPGAARLAVALPLLALNLAAAPLLFDGESELISNLVTFIGSVVTSMKVGSRRWGRGGGLFGGLDY